MQKNTSINNMTHEQAKEIIEKYGNKAGRRPADYYTAIEVLGIEKQSSTTKKTRTEKPNVIRNEDINDNEKFRYVRAKQVENMNKKEISINAHHVWLALQVSPCNNSLGAFEISFNQISAQTGGIAKHDVINAINELIAINEVRYVNGVIYLTQFHKNQKQHGNHKQLKGIINNYNQLTDKHKLPYIGTLQANTLDEAVQSFATLVTAIELLGRIDAGDDKINISDYITIYTREQIKSIANGAKCYVDTVEGDFVTVSQPQQIEVVELIGEVETLQPLVETIVEQQLIDVTEIESNAMPSKSELIFKISETLNIETGELFNSTQLRDELITRVLSANNWIEELEKIKSEKESILSKIRVKKEVSQPQQNHSQPQQSVEFKNIQPPAHDTVYVSKDNVVLKLSNDLNISLSELLENKGLDNVVNKIRLLGDNWSTGVDEIVENKRYVMENNQAICNEIDSIFGFETPTEMKEKLYLEMTLHGYDSIINELRIMNLQAQN